MSYCQASAAKKRKSLLHEPSVCISQHPCASLQAAQEIDESRNEAAKAEAEATGLRAALDAARDRHFEQLSRSDMLPLRGIFRETSRQAARLVYAC